MTSAYDARLSWTPDGKRIVFTDWMDPATGIVGAAGTKSIGWVVAAAGPGSTTAGVRLVPGIA